MRPVHCVGEGLKPSRQNCRTKPFEKTRAISTGLYAAVPAPRHPTVPSRSRPEAAAQNEARKSNDFNDALSRRVSPDAFSSRAAPLAAAQLLVSRIVAVRLACNNELA